MKTALYRHYSRAGRLLYVGITDDLARRTKQHGRARWHRFVTRSDTEYFPNRQEAETSEREAIKTERPIYNVIHKAAKESEELKQARAEIDRLNKELASVKAQLEKGRKRRQNLHTPAIRFDREVCKQGDSTLYQQVEIAALRNTLAEKDLQLAKAQRLPAPKQRGGDQIPKYKRRIDYQKKLAKAKKGILNGDVEASVEGVVRHCSCGNNRARAIIADLVEADVLERFPTGRVALKGVR